MSTTEQFIAAMNGAESSGASSREDLFALTDEQILEIAPDDTPEQSTEENRRDAITTGTVAARDNSSKTETTNSSSPQTSNNSVEPPQWLADMMADPQAGGEARDFWSGIQQARQEAAAFREVVAKPEEARVAVERARILDDMDRAYFGTAGNSPEQLGAARAELATRMMQQDPVAFREMVFAGLRALEAAGAKGQSGKSVTAPIRERGDGAASGTTANSSSSPATVTAEATQQQDARISAYAAFEKAANEDLARSVGGVIERTLEQALPNASVGGGSNAERSQRGGALKERLSNAIRQEVEKTLQADRQLGEQVAQILSGRRLDENTRSQVVRLIGERARQIVPGAAKRVLQDWTQTTLASHRSRNERSAESSARRDVAPVAATSMATNNFSSRTNSSQQRETAGYSQNSRRNVDYRKVSDEQILEM